MKIKTMLLVVCACICSLVVLSGCAQEDPRTEVYFPQLYFEDTSKEGKIKTLEEMGASNIQVYDNGDVRAAVTTSMHKKIVDALSDAIKQMLDNLTTKKDKYPDLESVEYNTDYSQITFKFSTADINENEKTLGPTVASMVFMLQTISGINSHIDTISYDAEGNEIASYSYDVLLEKAQKELEAAQAENSTATEEAGASDAPPSAEDLMKEAQKAAA